MSDASARDLRNHGTEVLARVEAGDRVTVTRAGTPLRCTPPPATRARITGRRRVVW